MATVRWNVLSVALGTSCMYVHVHARLIFARSRSQDTTVSRVQVESQFDAPPGLLKSGGTDAHRVLSRGIWEVAALLHARVTDNLLFAYCSFMRTCHDITEWK